MHQSSLSIHLFMPFITPSEKVVRIVGGSQSEAGSLPQAPTVCRGLELWMADTSSSFPVSTQPRQNGMEPHKLCSQNPSQLSSSGCSSF